MTFEQAVYVNRQIGGSGVGIVLGDEGLDPDWALGGIDLDTCRDETGRLTQWADEVVERIASYTEVSPSRTGVKVFFLYRKADKTRLQARMFGKHGRVFTEADGSREHPPAIDIELSHRYFAVTGKGYRFHELRRVETDAIEWVLTEAGPRLAGSTVSSVAQSSPHADPGRRGGTDTSRSAEAYNLASDLYFRGMIDTRDEMVARLEKASPRIREWVEEKGRPNHERELRRLWDRLPKKRSKVAQNMDEIREILAAERASRPQGECDTGGATPPPSRTAPQTPSPEDGRPASGRTPGEPSIGVVGLFTTRAEDRLAPDPEWLIDGIIPDESDLCIYAESQVLKSFIAADLALGIATGLPTLGEHKVKRQAPAFYFAAEGHRGMQKKRITAWEIGQGLTPFTAPDFFLAETAPPLNDAAAVDRYIAEMKSRLDGRPNGIFVIDTLNRALNGAPEDKSETAAQYLNVAKRIRTAVGGSALVVAHTGKDKSRGLRGSSAWFAGFDCVVEIAHHHKSGDGTHYLRLVVVKQKDDDDGRQILLKSKLVKWQNDRGDHLGSLVLVPADSDEYRQAIADKGKPCLALGMVTRALRDLAARQPTKMVAENALAAKIADFTGMTSESTRNHLRAVRQNDQEEYAPYWRGSKWGLPEDST